MQANETVENVVSLGGKLLNFVRDGQTTYNPIIAVFHLLSRIFRTKIY